MILIISSCTPSADKSLKQIKVYENSLEIGKLSDIIKTISPVFLETNKNCFISKVQQVRYTNEYIFITDFPGTKLLQFGKNGNFIRQIGSNGQGPTEYSFINCFAINEEQEQLFVVSGRKLLCFGFNGEFVNSKKQENSIEYVEIINNELWVVISKNGTKTSKGKYLNETKLFKLNSNYQYKDSLLVKSVEQERPMFVFLPNSFLFSTAKQHVNFYYPVFSPAAELRDTLYEIKNFELYPLIKLNFIDKTWNESIQNELAIRNIYRTKRYLFAEYIKQGKQKLFCADLKMEKQWNLTDGFDDDVYNTGSAKIFPTNMIESEFYFVKNAHEITTQFDNVKENDNPVLMLVKLKE